MGVNKITYGNETLIDLTSDTVTPQSLTLGATAHDANGDPIVGSYEAPQSDWNETDTTSPSYIQNKPTITDTQADWDETDPTSPAYIQNKPVISSVQKSDVVDWIYPVGSIYMSVGNTSPAVLFGGTWVQIKDTFLLASGTTYSNGDTGGAATVTLTAAQSGVPSHGHSFTQPSVTGGNGTSISGSSATTGSGSSHYHGPSGYTYFIQSNGSSISRSQIDEGNGSYGTVKGVYHNESYPITGVNKTGSESSHTHSIPTHSHTMPSHTHTVSGGAVSNNTAADASSAHNNMPPYLVVNVWKRTA